MSTVRLTVQGHGSHDVAAGTSLLELCEELDIPMECECGGFAACNSCRVRVVEGSEGLTPLVEEELPFLDRDDQRLGCQAEVIGPVTVELDPGI